MNNNLRIVLLILIGMLLCGYIAIHLGDATTPRPAPVVTTTR
jgi:hypothetical protein